MIGPTTWTVTAVAAKLGLSVPTLRSWERRYGIAPSHRTDGGHRRYTSADVASLQHMQDLIRAGTSTSDAAKRLLLEPDPEGLHAAVDRMDSAAIAHQARLLVTRYGTEYAWMTQFVPLLRDAGELWLSNFSGIAIEHVLSDALLLVLQESTTQRMSEDKPRVLLASTSQEQHTLPLYAAASGFAERRISSRVLGRVPGDVVVELAEELQPDVVFVWSRSPETAEPDTLRRVADHARTIAAGPGWGELPQQETVHDLAETLRVLAHA
ncbi:MerR family transcriptional regulator [Smaragdicoccus niigatensis]|uniref:MerR family transcriptional regulator n=1 Tax=Smaragdicoccus niigatensis TaxID=359359 RepID=UPI00037BF7AE|nr:MerR family transcriptional regulator [Smaragdicoccus niigatensis]